MIQHIVRYGAAVFLLLVCLVSAASGQDETRIQIAAVDISGFPEVRITLKTADTRSAPAELSGLILQENGLPVSDFNLDNSPVGIDAIFVIDANTGFGEVDDDSGLTRREKVIDSIQRFTSQYMNPNGLDRISIVVPSEDGQSGTLLLQDASDPLDVMTALEAYDPARLGPTSLNAMLNLALEHTLQSPDRARYQAILLFSDARRMDEQLSYPLLIAQANDSDIPIYGAILGQSADEEELSNMARLTEPTQAFHIHMPQAMATDPIYDIWQQQGNPVQVIFRSRQRQSGRNQVSINLGSSLVSTEFEVDLAAPTIQLALPAGEIQRVGTAPDTPLEALQPQFQPMSVNISWPDGFPRKLIEVIVLANNIPQPISDTWQESSGPQLELVWDIKNIDEGPIELFVQALDELGYQGSSNPQTIHVSIERPLPPTAAPTPIPREPDSDTPPPADSSWRLYTVIIIGVLLIFAAFIWYWRLRTRKKAAATVPAATATTGKAPKEPAADAPRIAVLEPLSAQDGEPIILDQQSLSFGSDARSAQIVLNDVSISRLHARIRRQEQTYWLLDEGSTDGVFLNYERLGLAPRELHDGDTVQFGKLTFRFMLHQDFGDKLN